MKIQIELNSRRLFTTNGERSGELAKALTIETTADLQAAYLECRQSADWSNPVFGGNAKRWEMHIGSELIRRGVDSFWHRDIFGTQTIMVRGQSSLF